ncbi:hypothetical protein EJB05_00191, partial [Eragrostis curvula]
MGVVHYRYRSGVQTFSVTVPGAFATVAELKRMIAATGRHGRGRTRGRGPREDIALCDPRTGEEYADENTLIPQNSTVLVHRIAGQPSDAIVASSIIIKGDAMASHKLVAESTLKLHGFTETDDEETAAVRTVIDAAEINVGGSSSGGGHAGGSFGSHFGIRPLEGEVPPPPYVCRLCHIPGHFIQHCPKSKLPPPGYICYKCGVPGHFIQCCPNYGDRKYESRKTCSLIPVVSSFDDEVPTERVQAMSSSIGDSLPAELHCPLCKKVMTDAMLTSKCCYDSFCDKCIRGYIIAHLKCICGAKILTDDLIPNQTLRSTIASMLSSRGADFSSGTGKLTNSSTSNVDGKSHSFTASAALKGDMKQHKDNMPSITTEGSHLITACKNPSEHGDKLPHSDLQSKTGKCARTSVKKTRVTAEASAAVQEPTYQNQPSPDGLAVVSGSLELKVIRRRTKKKKKTTGTTGSGITNCSGYNFHIPYDPSCYNSFGFGGLTWPSDPYNMYLMLNMPSSSYPMGLYGVNGIGNLPPLAPGMQGYPISHYREFQPTVRQDRKPSAHARQAESGKDTGMQSHKSERYHSCPSTHKGRSKSGSRSVSERRDSSVESHDHDEFHSRKRMRHVSSPRNADQRRSRKSSSKHSYRKHAYEDSTSSDEESNFKRAW